MEIHDLGLCPYDEAHRLQKTLVLRVRENPALRCLVLAEHPAVFTIGRFGSEKSLKRVGDGVAVRRIERGGDATYHGQGQLVGYPILDLYRSGLTVRKFIRRIEEALIRAAAASGVRAGFRDGSPGVWVGEKKLASIGLALSGRVTYHGFALNVNVDLDPFDRIDPCGMPGLRMTSLRQELSGAVDMEAVKTRVVRELVASLRLDDRSKAHRYNP